MVIKVNAHQRGNNVLDYLTRVRWNFEENLTTDYEIENFISVIFISLRFHTAKPEYIIARLNELKDYKVCILLILVDIRNYEQYLKEFVCLDQQIFYCFSNDEAAKYLALLDLSANKSTDLLKKKYSQNHFERKQEFLSKFPKLNKNDSQDLSQGKSLHSLLVKDSDDHFENQKLSNAKKTMLNEFLDMDFEIKEDE